MTERIEWLKARQTGIGGSDVAAILGLSKWKTPLDVYNDKIADTPSEESNPSIEWGNRLEPVIRQKYSDVTGLSVKCPEETFRLLREGSPGLSSASGGLGIGLSIVHLIADRHGCELRFERRSEGGLEVRVDVPLATPNINQRTAS